ncbi:hypothetical protein K438DRAFT_1773493 [Mycena galopus ATCC 62051]|nr:hypothetical protein K438DRAFT_1773493 [Mycena galopus ATCC 62051]
MPKLVSGTNWSDTTMNEQKSMKLPLLRRPALQTGAIRVIGKIEFANFSTAGIKLKLFSGTNWSDTTVRGTPAFRHFRRSATRPTTGLTSLSRPTGLSSPGFGLDIAYAEARSHWHVLCNQAWEYLNQVELYKQAAPLKTFVRGSNLHVTNVDMDGAQVIGLTRSVIKYSDPEYSRVPLDTPPEKVAPKVCWRHAKEPTHDFRSLISTSDFNWLKNCFYIEDKEALNVFSAFVHGLRIKKITDWWKHKEMHEWIIPFTAKSQSGISAET